MAGRVKRKAGLAAAEMLLASRCDARECALCARALGERIEWHHPVPRSQGGRETVPVHPICHRTIHATFSNVELARSFADPAAVRTHPAIARFLSWIADKPADFQAPTRRRSG